MSRSRHKESIMNLSGGLRRIMGKGRHAPKRDTHTEKQTQGERVTKNKPATVCHANYDAQKVTQYNLETVVHALYTHSIEYVVLPSLSLYNPIVAISLEDEGNLLQALK